MVLRRRMKCEARNPGRAEYENRPIPDCASLHPGYEPTSPYFASRRFARFCAIDENTLLSWLAWLTL
jgi:hypothetical protein